MELKQDLASLSVAIDALTDSHISKTQIISSFSAKGGAYIAYSVLDNNLKPVDWSSLHLSMQAYRNEGNDSLVKSTFQQSKQVFCAPQPTNGGIPASWIWHIDSEPRVRGGRLLVRIRYRLEVLEGLCGFRHRLLQRMCDPNLAITLRIIWEDVLGGFGCIHIPKDPQDPDSPFHRDLYNDFQHLHQTSTTMENVHLGTCAWCNAELFTNIRLATDREQPTYRECDDRVFETIRFVDLGEGLPHDRTRWEANTRDDGKSRLTELWDLRMLFEGNATMARVDTTSGLATPGELT